MKICIDCGHKYLHLGPRCGKCLDTHIAGRLKDTKREIRKLKRESNIVLRASSISQIVYLPDMTGESIMQQLDKEAKNDV